MENSRAEACNCMDCEDKCEFFKRLTEDQWEKLNTSKKALHYRKGEVIIKKGGFNPYIILVSSGFVKVMVEAEHEKCFIMELMGPQNIITGNVFENNLSHYSIAAITDTVICHLDAEIFIALLEANGLFSTDIIKYTNQHAAMRFQRLHSITLKQSRGKLADVILYLHELNQDIVKYLSRQDLADMANISMENAIRTLKEFADEGLINIEKKDIQVVNPEGLRRVSKMG